MQIKVELVNPFFVEAGSVLIPETDIALFMHILGKVPVKDSVANRKALTVLAPMHGVEEVLFL